MHCADGDGIPDYLDSDSDNDGVPGGVEAGDDRDNITWMLGFQGS